MNNTEIEREAIIGLLSLLGFEKYIIIDNELVAIFDTKDDTEYHLLSSNGTLLCDETIKSVTLLPSGEYVLELSKYDVEDELNDILGLAKDKKAVLVYSPSSEEKFVTNCDKLKNKYNLMTDIELDKMIQYKGCYYTRSEVNVQCHYFLAHKRERI